MKYRCLKIAVLTNHSTFGQRLLKAPRTCISHRMWYARPLTFLITCHQISTDNQLVCGYCISPIRSFVPPIIRRKLWPWCGNHSSYSKWRDNHYANVSPHLSEDLLAYRSLVNSLSRDFPFPGTLGLSFRVSNRKYESLQIQSTTVFPSRSTLGMIETIPQIGEVLEKFAPNAILNG